MKKKLAIFAAIIVLLFGGLLGFAAYNANSIIAKYKPSLEKIASDAVGSKVSLGDLQVSVFPNTRLVADKFSVGGGDGEGLTLNNLTLMLRLFPLLSGKLDITTLSLDSPSITILKDASGISIVGLPKKDAKAAAPADKTKNSKGPKEKKPAAAPSVPIDLNLDTFKLTNAKILFKDAVAGKDYDVVVDVESGFGIESNKVRLSDLSVNGKALSTIDFGLDSDLSYQLKEGKLDLTKMAASFLGNVINLTGQVDSKNLSGTIDIDSKTGVTLESFGPIFDIFAPTLKAFNMTGSAKPALKTSFGPGGAFKADGKIALSGMGLDVATIPVRDLQGSLLIEANQALQKLTSEGLQVSVRKELLTIALEAAAEKNKAKVNKIAIKGFGGTINSDASVTLNDKKPFVTKATVNGVHIEKLISAVKPEVPLTIVGTMDSLTLNMSGAVAPNLMQSLRGTAKINMTDGELKGVNLAGKILKAVVDLPFLSGSLYDSVPASERAELESSNTKIRSLTGDVTISGPSLRTKNLLLISNLFQLEGAGTVGFNATVDLDATIRFNTALSEKMALSVKELKALKDREGRIAFPLRLKGQVPSILVYPDVKKILKAGVQKKLEDKAGDLLGKALGGEGKIEVDGIGGLLGF